VSTTSGLYDDRFFAEQADDGGATASAQRVLPLVLDLLTPRTVVDVGCGTGGWLHTLTTLADVDITGLDGDYVPRDRLAIPVDRFVPTDLARPVRLDQRFDLAMSFEVAEHLPASRSAGFVEDLTRLADAVLFSAAVPGQGGVGHINEQWPSYWIEHFAQQGFEAWDLVRPALWHDPDVAYCYRQNTFVFVDPAVHGHRPDLAPAVPDAAHPELLRLAVEATATVSLRDAVTQLPPALGRSLAFHTRRIRSARRP
jgi:SAM-dependent methyltransferase